MLVLGGLDINVDVNETREIYEKYISSDHLKVNWIDYTNHYIVRKKLVNKDFALFLGLIFKPKEVIAPEYIYSINNFLNNLNN